MHDAVDFGRLASAFELLAELPPTPDELLLLATLPARPVQWAGWQHTER